MNILLLFNAKSNTIFQIKTKPFSEKSLSWIFLFWRNLRLSLQYTQKQCKLEFGRWVFVAKGAY